jgi:hypothetical protein
MATGCQSRSTAAEKRNAESCNRSVPLPAAEYFTFGKTGLPGIRKRTIGEDVQVVVS